MSGRGRRLGLAAALAVLGVPLATAARADPPAPAAPVRRADLLVTCGRIGEEAPGRLTIDVPEVRAIVPGSDGTRAELRFRALGPSAGTRPLASGDARRQIGLKLRALDDCNLLYVMWRAGPPGLVVQLKRNPGRRTHRECAAGGYRTLRAARGTAPGPLAADGAEHLLAAELDGATLRVFVDGALAWEGPVPEDAADLAGPAGLRSDNGRFDLELRTGPASLRP